MQKSKIIPSSVMYEENNYAYDVKDLNDQLSMVRPFKLTLSKIYTVKQYRFANKKLETTDDLVVRLINQKKNKSQHNLLILLISASYLNLVQRIIDNVSNPSVFPDEKRDHEDL